MRTAGGDRAARETQILGWLFVAPAMSWSCGAGPLSDGPRVPAEHPSRAASCSARSRATSGLRNYRDVLNDPTSRDAMRHTRRVRACWRSSLEIVLGIFVAVTLHRVFRGRGFVLAMLILPWALPSVVSGVLWRRVFDPDNGLLNSVLLQLHVISAAARLAGLRAGRDRLHHARPRLGRAAAGQPDLPGRAAEHPRRGLQRVGGRRRRPVAPVPHITLPLLRPSMAIALTVGYAACDRDLRRDLRAERHRAEHALDPDPGLQHDVRPRPTSPTARRWRSCWPRLTAVLGGALRAGCCGGSTV